MAVTVAVTVTVTVSVLFVSMFGMYLALVTSVLRRMARSFTILLWFVKINTSLSLSGGGGGITRQANQAPEAEAGV